MGRQESQEYKERLKEMTGVLRKHNITRGVSPEKLRLILEDLGPTFIKLGQIMSMHSLVPRRGGQISKQPCCSHSSLDNYGTIPLPAPLPSCGNFLLTILERT